MLKTHSYHNKKKLFYLSSAACLIAAAYAILRPFKIAVFYQMVGKEYFPFTKILMILFILPCLALYSKLIDCYKKQNVLFIIFVGYSLICSIFALILLHPSFGISNTQPSPYRITGWIFTGMLDLYPTFIIGAFWAFTNSISTPDFAKKGYGVIIAFVKIGSIASATASWFFMKNSTNTQMISLFIILAAILTASSLFFIVNIMKKVPEKNLVGYQAKKQEYLKKKKAVFSNIFEGLAFMIKNPYVFGIFLLYFCYEIIFTVIEYQTTVQLSVETANNTLAISSMLFFCTIISQGIGLIFALVGTATLLRYISLKITLMVMPLFTATLIVILFFSPNLTTMLILMTLLPALNFGLNAPVREMLYIPTVKEIQFKSKSWIDSFGRSISKSSGSMINIFIYHSATSIFSLFATVLSLGIGIVWVIVAYFMGRSYKRVIDKKDIIS